MVHNKCTSTLFSWNICVYVIFWNTLQSWKHCYSSNWRGIQRWKAGCSGVLLRMSVADLRAHLSLCGFPFSEDHDRDLSIPRVAYRGVLPDSAALSPLPMLQHSGLSAASQKGDTSSGPRPPAHAGPTVTTAVVNPSAFTPWPRIFLTRLGSPFCSLSRLCPPFRAFITVGNYVFL